MPAIAQLLPFLADGWEEKCLELGVIQRQRGIKTPQDLMMLNLFHLVNGCSLMEISEAGRLLKIGEFSDVAFMKRFEKCGDWFAWISGQLSRNIVAEYNKPEFLESYRPIAFDASDVVEKGRSGQRFRLHYGIDIFGMCTASYKITTLDIGETLCNFPFKKGDLAIGDRMYGTANGIEHCIKNGADFLLRIRSNCGKFYDKDGKEIDIALLFDDLKPEECGEISAFKRTSDGRMLSVRVCVKRKTETEYQKTLKKLKIRETTHMCKTRDTTKEFNRFIVIATSLPGDISPCDVLETYRYRWQIEMYFKRLKSIMDFGDLPKKREESSLAWINGKLMVALLIELFLSSIAFSPEYSQNYKSEYLA